MTPGGAPGRPTRLAARSAPGTPTRPGARLGARGLSYYSGPHDRRGDVRRRSRPRSVPGPGGGVGALRRARRHPDPATGHRRDGRSAVRSAGQPWRGHRGRAQRRPHRPAGQAGAGRPGRARTPRGVVFGRRHDGADLRLLPHAGQARGVPGTRWSSPGSTTTPTSGRGCRRPQAVGATVRWADFDPATAELTPSDVAPVLSARTRLVAVTAASNLLGTRPDRRAPIAGWCTASARCSTSTGCTTPRTRRWTSARSARTSTPARRTSSSARTAACSRPHPALLETLRPDKLLPSTDVVPERFELGTLPYELLAGATAAVDFLAGLGPDPHESRRDRLRAGRWPRSSGTRTRLRPGSRRAWRSCRASSCTPAPRPGDADAAARPSRAASTGRPTTFLAARGVERARRVVLRAGGVAAARARRRRAGCASGWRRTPTTATWTGSWPGWPTSSRVGQRGSGSGPNVRTQRGPAQSRRAENRRRSSRSTGRYAPQEATLRVS